MRVLIRDIRVRNEPISFDVEPNEPISSFSERAARILGLDTVNRTPFVLFRGLILPEETTLEAEECSPRSFTDSPLLIGMHSPRVSETLDFDEIRSRVSEELTHLDPNLLYHGRNHTIVDVLPTSVELGTLCRLSDHLLLLLELSALYHDTGFLDRYEKNEEFGSERALATLSEFLDRPSLERISRAIMSTQLPQNPDPEDLISCLLCDSDLGHLGKTELFFERTEALREEINRRIAEAENRIDERSWNESNLRFVGNHRFWSEVARVRFAEGKQEILRRIREWILD